jgi:hypothetical protein
MREDWQEHLSDLPELEDYVEEMQPDGSLVRFRKIYPVDLFGGRHAKDPFAFSNEEGAWYVVYGYEGGPHKVRA